jgi:hypothetical protein
LVRITSPLFWYESSGREGRRPGRISPCFFYHDFSGESIDFSDAQRRVGWVERSEATPVNM